MPTATRLDIDPDDRTGDHIDDDVPRGVRVTAAWSWRGIVIAGAAYVLILLVDKLQLVIIPAAIALLLTALLQPMVAWLRRLGVPPSLAAGAVMVAGIAAVFGILAGVVHSFINGLSDLSDKVSGGIQEIRDWLRDGPLNLTNDQIDNALDTLQTTIKDHQDDITAGALDTATTVSHILAGFFLVLFATFFFLKDGNHIWAFVVRILPRAARPPMDQAGYYAWQTLISYVRATVLVAAVDALGIGLAVWLLGVPLAIPLAALVFLSSFIPILGATLSGGVAVLVALVAKGPVVALLILLAVIAVQQLEGHVLQPLLMGRAVAIHPLAVLLAISGGLVLAGITGALLAVPLVAAINTSVRYLKKHHHGESVGPHEPNPPGTKATDPKEAELEREQEAADEEPVPPPPAPA
ncbi:MAG: AI-2E family transporter [Corynebacteriales bacterium]|nr:AI-2E family transporter [Mycobacteriales bacterium]